MTRVNIPLPDKLHQRLRIAAVERDTTIKQLVIELLEAEL